MSFKPTNAKIDLSLDMSDYLIEGDEEKLKDGIIFPKKSPTAAEYVSWAEKASTPSEDKEEEEKRFENPSYAMDKIIEQIDFWYGKGKDWWVKRCPFPVLQEILNYIQDKVTNIRKK